MSKKKRIRILFIIPHLKAGGAEKVMSFLFDNISRQIFDPFLIIVGSKSQNHFSLSKRDVKYLNKTRFRHAIPKLIFEIIRIKPQIIFSSIGHINLYISFLKYFFRNTKMIARETNIYSYRVKYNSGKDFLPFFIKKILYNNLDRIIYQSNDMKKDFEKSFSIPKNRTIVIPNPINETRQQVKKKIVNHKVIQIVTVGRLVKYKGHERILKLLSQINLNFKYTIVGDGPERSEIEKIVSELELNSKVKLTGTIKNVTEIYSNADFFIQGSYIEGFPNVILEALSFGIPCIVFKSLGGQNEIIRDWENGIFVNEKIDSKDLLLKAIQRKWDKQKIIDDVYCRYNSKKIINMYETFLKEIN